MSTTTTAPSPRGGPRTPEGKARSAQNARKHGLRARDFLLSPDENTADWALHLATCEQGYGPIDAHERNMVCAIAAAMWNEIRADRAMGEVMARIPPPRQGDSHGTDAAEPAHALSLNTAIRYQTAASMATQRSQRAFFAYRTARLDGVIVPCPAPPEPANANFTNEPPPDTSEPSGCGPQQKDCTNEPLPDTPEPDKPAAEPAQRTHEPAPAGLPPAPAPLAALRARLDRLVRDGHATSPGDHDLLAAIRALKLPGAAPYRGPIDPTHLQRLLTERRFEVGGLAWLAGFGPPPAAAPGA